MSQLELIFYSFTARALFVVIIRELGKAIRKCRESHLTAKTLDNDKTGGIR